MRIEPATARDLDDLADAWVDLAETQRRHGSHLRASANRDEVQPLLAHHVVQGTVLVAWEEAGRDDDWAGDGRAPRDRTDGARVDGDRDADVLVGFVNFGLEEGALESDATRGVVHNLYVVPDSRGGGVGSSLLDAAESALADRGADVVAIEALWGNEGARRLYERRGYEPHRVQFERTVGNDTNTKDGV